MVLATSFDPEPTEPARGGPAHPGGPSPRKWDPLDWWRRRDPLRRHRAVVGTRAQIRWWERSRAIVGLVVIVTGAGIALAAVIGGAIFLGGFLLESAVR